MVRDGTYLIGSATMVRASDLPLVLQSHILRLRFNPDSGMGPEAWLVALGSPFVKAQLRAIQFTADIIDTIGDRWREITVPIPATGVLDDISEATRRALSDRHGALVTVGDLSREWCGGIDAKLVARYSPYSRTESRLRAGFVQPSSQIQRSIFIPRYYDPDIDIVANQLSKTRDLVTIHALEQRGALDVNTGIEVGKMAYGTGSIPFVRTADLANQEVKPDPKQGVSEEIWEQNRQDIRPYDILLVRDGTYLVGSTAMIAEDQIKMLYCGGLYRIRATDESVISPEELLIALNSNYVRAQMRARQFTRDIIDTIGRRLMEVRIPLLREGEERATIRAKARAAIDSRARARVTLSGLSAAFPNHVGERRD